MIANHNDHFLLYYWLIVALVVALGMSSPSFAFSPCLHNSYHHQYQQASNVNKNGGGIFSFTTRQSSLSSLSASSSSSTSSSSDLNIAIVGAGPSGALLANLLLKKKSGDDDNTNNNNIKVTLLESRSDPRKLLDKESNDIGRAYALGIGIRGRTSIRQVDEQLWNAVKAQGYESERFQLHIGPFVIPLRSEKDSTDSLSQTKTNGDNQRQQQIEPSLLMFQSDLCGAMIDELENRYIPQGSNNNNRDLQMLFETRVDNIECKDMYITTNSDDKNSRKLGPFDLIVGCDGVNSAVRTTMGDVYPAFETTTTRLPGEFKVVQLDSVPPNIDPTSVSLIFPKSGSCTAFVEPTSNDGNCCILFAGGGSSPSPIISETQNKTAVIESLEQAFPQWEHYHDVIATQLMARTNPGSASSVQCNTYHYANKLVLVGDAAHATGGVSGQGVNSALVDAAVLAQCISQHRDSIDEALLAYSKKQVPEGKALYDLSFGPKPTGFKALKYGFQTLKDTLFRGKFGIGKQPLQTVLTTNLISFASLRREKDKYYDEPFPTRHDFDTKLNSLHKLTTEDR